jgi:hypothetical protein
MRTITRLAAVIAVPVLGVLGASHAWAHDVVAPSRVAGGTSTTVTLAVVNEHDLPTDGVEARLPAGFVYGSHEQVPGWTSSLVKQNGAVSAIRWSGGLLQSNETGQFVLAGTPAKQPGSLVWVVAQKSLGRGSYVAPPISFSPQMTVSTQPLDASPTAAPVPLAGASSGGSGGGTVDGVARSRATLALVLAGLALVAVVFFEMTLVRRGQLTAAAARGGEAADESAQAAPASGKAAPSAKSPAAAPGKNPQRKKPPGKSAKGTSQPVAK